MPTPSEQAALDRAAEIRARVDAERAKTLPEARRVRGSGPPVDPDGVYERAVANARPAAEIDADLKREAGKAERNAAAIKAATQAARQVDASKHTDSPTAYARSEGRQGLGGSEKPTAEERARPYSVPTRHALKAPYMGGAEGPKPANHDVPRGVKAVVPSQMVVDGIAAPIAVATADSVLSDASKKHKLHFSNQAKAEYEMLFTVTKLADSVTFGNAPAIAQSKLVEWGKKYNVPPDALTDLQMTRHKMTKEQIETIMHGVPSASLDAPAAGGMENAQSAVAKLDKPAAVTQMASIQQTTAPTYSPAAIPGPDADKISRA